MPISLDIKGQRKEDNAAKATNKTVINKSTVEQTHSQATPLPARSRQGRPKGEPAVTRSLRIRADINERLVKEHERTHISYNELVNLALDAFLKR